MFVSFIASYNRHDKEIGKILKKCFTFSIFFSFSQLGFLIGHLFYVVIWSVIVDRAVLLF